jgi:hypothetical protein
MSSPRLIASLFALSAGAVLIASCGEQGSPTNPSSMASTSVQAGATATEYTDMLADPAGPRLRALDDGTTPAEPIVYPPNSAPDPWPPGPPPIALPGIPMPTPPSTHIRLHITVNPEPVPYSGVPIPIFSCRDNQHTWYYDQVLVTDTGLAVTFTKRENFFDGRYTSTNTDTVTIGGNTGITLHTKWCSAYPKPHYAQTRFTGRDETGEPVVISGPLVRLLTP